MTAVPPRSGACWHDDITPLDAQAMLSAREIEPGVRHRGSFRGNGWQRA